jgi:hypothetical protein
VVQIKAAKMEREAVGKYKTRRWDGIYIPSQIVGNWTKAAAIGRSKSTRLGAGYDDRLKNFW